MKDFAAQHFLGAQIQQNWPGLYMLEHTLNSQKFELIIELGTGFGALAVFFSYHAPTISFDKIDQRQMTGGYLFCKRDVFNYNTHSFIGWKTINKKTLFFCDNGDKPKECQLYSKMVKPGDLMIMHDYPRLITLKDVPGILELYNQEPFDRLETKMLCLRKKPY